MNVQWIRSWPDPEPPKRSYVKDSLPRFYMSQYDHTKLVPYNEGIRLNLIEWDIAIGREDMERWSTIGELYPDRVVVAPVLYYDEKLPHYVHRSVKVWRNKRTLRWIFPGDHTCDYAGFSLISFPPNYLRYAYEWIKAGGVGTETRLTDTTFSTWMHEKRREQFIIDWRIQPVHLNYTTTAILEPKFKLPQLLDEPTEV